MSKMSSFRSRLRARLRSFPKAVLNVTFVATIVSALLVGGTVRASEPAPNSSPMAELKKSNSQLDKVLQKNKPNWSPEAELERTEVRKLVGSFLDYAEL